MRGTYKGTGAWDMPSGLAWSSDISCDVKKKRIWGTRQNTCWCGSSDWGGSRDV